MTPAKRAFLQLVLWMAIVTAVPFTVALIASTLSQSLRRWSPSTALGWLPVPLRITVTLALLAAIPYILARGVFRARRDTAYHVVVWTWVVVVGTAYFLWQ